MIDATQKKLREVSFFLAHLERVTFSATTEPNEAISFYMSAFLSAARSVAFVLEAEEPQTYPGWSRAWRATLTEDERTLLADFTSARNRALKRETPLLAEDHLASSQQHPYSEMPVELRFFLEEELPEPSNRVFKGRLSSGRAEVEIVPLCRQHASLLSILVTAFIEFRQ
jgi:hypothetical protein